MAGIYLSRFESSHSMHFGFKDVAITHTCSAQCVINTYSCIVQAARQYWYSPRYDNAIVQLKSVLTVPDETNVMLMWCEET